MLKFILNLLRCMRLKLQRYKIRRKMQSGCYYYHYHHRGNVDHKEVEKFVVKYLNGEIKSISLKEHIKRKKLKKMKNINKDRGV